MDHGIRHPRAVVPEVSPNNGIRIGLEFLKQMPRTQLVARAPEISPESFRNARTIKLFRQHREGSFPLRQCRAVSLPVVRNRKFVVDVWTLGRKFQRAIVVGDSLLRIALASVVISERQISRGARWALL